MKSDTVIRVEGVGKTYRLGTAVKAYDTLRDAVARRFRGWRHDGPEHEQDSTFWALRDINFTMKRGEVLGIIGRNGSGKSTLLKIISRITTPTTGHIEISGRVGTLLEVGTGFHPELTGRENVFLNGAILGMKRGEIRSRFSEIVEFAGVEKFLDTPVKRYSSGMRVRLGFSVAAHLNPDILLVDEVLSVGDISFQRKCLGKMSEVADSGRSVIVVSHNLTTISSMCESCLWLDRGISKGVAAVQESIRNYLASADATSHQNRLEMELYKPGQYTSIEVGDGAGTDSSEISCDDPIFVNVEFLIRKPLPGLFLTCLIQSIEGHYVLMTDSRDARPDQMESLSLGRHAFQIEIPARSLAPGVYFVTASSTAFGHSFVDLREQVCSFRVHDFSTVRGNNRVGFHSMILEWYEKKSSPLDGRESNGDDASTYKET